MERQSLKEVQDLIVSLEKDISDMSCFRTNEKWNLIQMVHNMKDYLNDIYADSLEFCLAKERYDEVVHNVSEFMRYFDLENPISILAFYSYMIKNGYLSYGHRFVYDKKTDDGLYLMGSNVVDGAGVCRHITSFLTDIYKEMGYDSYNIGMMLNPYIRSYSKQKYSFVNHKNDLNYYIKKMIRFLITDYNVSFNHLVTLVNDDNGSLLVDPTNDIVFFVHDDNRVSPVIERKISMSCDYVSVFNDDRSRYFLDLLRVTDASILDDISFWYGYGWNTAKKYSNLFQYFYHDNYALYKDVVEKRKILVREFKRYLSNT